MVPEAGLEPALCYQNWILNPARLPISPLRQDLRGAKYIYASGAVPVFKSQISAFCDIRFIQMSEFVFKPDPIEISLDMRIEMIVIHQEGIMPHQ
jgi:hypothetical protein